VLSAESKLDFWPNFSNKQFALGNLVAVHLGVRNQDPETFTVSRKFKFFTLKTPFYGHILCPLPATYPG
jgi:hypothetical protein